MRALLTILGSGTSTGVPTLLCECPVCSSRDPRDRRLRPSVWLRFHDRSVLIDTSPDFRAQAIRAGIRTLDAVLFTHSHADHVMGLDDIRPFNFGRPDPLPIYGNERTIADIKRIFQYVFEDGYPESAIPRICPHVIDSPVELFGVEFEPIPVFHGRLPILGYRFGNNAYVTDVSEIPTSSADRLRGLDVLILDALRHRPHPTHLTLASSVKLVQDLKPRRAFFTHIAHELSHAGTEATLPPTMHLAYDGLELAIEV